MAKNRIKGITIEIGGNTQQLQDSLKAANNTIKATQDGLKDVNNLLKMDPGNVELLKQKQDYLNEAITATKDKLEQEKQAALEKDAAPQTQENPADRGE